MMALPGAHAARHALLAEVGVPDEIVDYVDMPTEFDTARAGRALAGSGIEVPPLASYAEKLWDYWRTPPGSGSLPLHQRDERRRGQDGADHRGVKRDR